MRSLSLGSMLLAVLLSACGSNYGAVSSTPAELKPRRASTDGNSYLIDLPAESGIHTTELLGTPQEVFPLVAKVYDELGIPIEMLQTSSFILGNNSFRARRQIGKIPMARIVDCGASATGARANSDVIIFNLKTQIREVGPNSVVVETSLSATAQSVEGASTNTVGCSSRGELEKRIAAGVLQHQGS